MTLGFFLGPALTPCLLGWLRSACTGTSTSIADSCVHGSVDSLRAWVTQHPVCTIYSTGLVSEDRIASPPRHPKSLMTCDILLAALVKTILTKAHK